MDQVMTGQKCACPHHKFVPILVVLFGLLFLLAAWDIFSARFVQIGWPVLVIIAGLQKMFAGKCKCC